MFSCERKPITSFHVLFLSRLILYANDKINHFSNTSSQNNLQDKHLLHTTLKEQDHFEFNLKTKIVDIFYGVHLLKNFYTNSDNICKLKMIPENIRAIMTKIKLRKRARAW